MLEVTRVSLSGLRTFLLECVSSCVRENKEMHVPPDFLVAEGVEGSGFGFLENGLLISSLPRGRVELLAEPYCLLTLGFMSAKMSFSGFPGCADDVDRERPLVLSCGLPALGLLLLALEASSDSLSVGLCFRTLSLLFLNLLG